MSAAITAAVAAVAGVALSYEQNRNARAAQREQQSRIKAEETKQAADLAWEKKKKAEQDILDSRNALRLRGTTGESGAGMNPTGLNTPLSAGLDKLGL